MNIKGFKWVGIRTDAVEETTHFLTDVLGVPLTHRDDDEYVAAFTFPSGQELVVFSQGNQYYDLHPHPVVAFDVDDIYAARREFEAKGVEFLTDIYIHTENPGKRWCYFRDPNGYIYELYQQPNGE